ncbi:MAG: DUF433 domain-containing protein, partial [Rhodomicrobium sp.]
MPALARPAQAFTRGASQYLRNIAVRPRCANRSEAELQLIESNDPLESGLEPADLHQWYEASRRGGLQAGKVGFHRSCGGCGSVAPSPRANDKRGISRYFDFMNTLIDRISIDPKVCGGKPCIKGTRIWVSLVLDFLAEGIREDEILADYPQLTPEDIRACIAYAAEIARERIVPVEQGCLRSLA